MTFFESGIYLHCSISFAELNFLKIMQEKTIHGKKRETRKDVSRSITRRMQGFYNEVMDSRLRGNDIIWKFYDK